jgi:hypothetical protein
VLEVIYKHKEGGKMLEIGAFKLKQLRDMFPRISEIALGKPNLEGIEEEFRPLSRGEEEFSLKHIEILKDAEHRYWRFLDWWRMPEIKQSEIDDLKRLFLIPRPPFEEMTKSLLAILKYIEITSCVLRFTDPVSYGILSPPVENLLNVRGNDDCEKYLRYLEALGKLRIEYGFTRNADVDMALWTLAHILNSAELQYSDTECKDIVKSYYGKPNLIKRISAKNSLDQFLDEKDYLNIADMFVETDHAIAAFIVGREIERMLKHLCKKNTIATMYRDLKGNLRDCGVGRMLKDLDLSGILSNEKRRRLKSWYDIRSDIVHDRRVVTKEDVERMLAGCRDLKMSYRHV